MADKFIVDSNVVKIGLDLKNCEDVLKVIATSLHESGYVKDSYSKGVLDREKVFPTGLPTGEYGVAIPHTDIEHVNIPMIAVATLKNPVDFCVMGGYEGEKVPIKIVFMLAMTDSNAQLQLLTSLISLIQDITILEKIYKAEDKEEIANIINSKINN